MDRKTPIFSTHGCRLNAFETEAMSRLASDAGVDDTVVINTCAVTAESVRKARKDIRQMRRQNPNARIVVTGCAAQIDPQSFASMPEVDVVIGNNEKMASETWCQLAAHGAVEETDKIRVDDIMSVRETASHLIDGFGTRSRAYVQVQNGCDHRCTFCIIPFGRGNSRSVPAGVVVQQIQRLVDRGYREVVLTGVDLTSWGADLPGTPRFGNLVRRILKLVPDLPRLRLSSIDSIEADAELMEALATEKRLMPHLHLSLQAGDDMILKRMKRRHLRDDAIAFCEEVRRLRPETTFGADLIAGFPTETDAMFQNSLRLVQECDLTWLHVFPYSARPGTPAARMPANDGSTVRQRAKVLRDAGNEAVSRHLEGLVGSRQAVLMESENSGRTESFAEVDLTDTQVSGSIVNVTIAEASTTRLMASPVT